MNGGEREIRTLDRVAPTPVFKTGAFNHSAISPLTQGPVLTWEAGNGNTAIYSKWCECVGVGLGDGHGEGWGECVGFGLGLGPTLFVQPFPGGLLGE